MRLEVGDIGTVTDNVHVGKQGGVSTPASQIIALKIGTTTEIEVAGTSPLLQTENANISSEVSPNFVAELPLNPRNVFNFVELNSSVNNQSQSQVLNGGGEQGSADPDVSFFNFGGGFFGTTAFFLDGAWDTSQGWGRTIYFHPLTTRRSSKSNKTHSPRNTAGALQRILEAQEAAGKHGKQMGTFRKKVTWPARA